MKTTNAQAKDANVVISAPKFQSAYFKIVGSAPYVQLKFSQKTKSQIMLAHMEGQKGKKKTTKEPRDFEEEYKNAIHYSNDGWAGIPASAFRQAIVSACRTVNFKMTLAKLSIFIEADGFDRDDGTPLVKINGKHEMAIHDVRNTTGVMDLRSRAMWRKWDAIVRVRWDTDQFNLTDVTNLLLRVGQQVGIGEGRADSKKSCGMGWGFFELAM